MKTESISIFTQNKQDRAEQGRAGQTKKNKPNEGARPVPYPSTSLAAVPASIERKAEHGSGSV